MNTFDTLTTFRWVFVIKIIPWNQNFNRKAHVLGNYSWNFCALKPCLEWRLPKQLGHMNLDGKSCISQHSLYLICYLYILDLVRLLHTSATLTLPLASKSKAKQTTRWVRGQFRTCGGGACSQHANIAVKTSRLIDYECDIGCPLIRIWKRSITFYFRRLERSRWFDLASWFVCRMQISGLRMWGECCVWSAWRISFFFYLTK